MTVSYFVRYAGPHSDGSPTTLGAFVDRYRDVHVPILLGMPGIRAVALHTPVAVADRFPVTPAGTHLLAELRFDDALALEAAFASEARARAREDFARMPAFSGTVTHEALAAEVFRP